MSQILCLLIITFFCFVNVLAQDIRNPDLFEQLKVKSLTVYFTGTINDTSVSKYDYNGRVVYFCGRNQYGLKSTDSTFYKNSSQIVKNYNSENDLASIVTTERDKQDNIVSLRREQFLPKYDVSGYTSIYKKGKLIDSRMFRNGEEIIIPERESKKGQIEYYYDSVYSYTLNNSELASIIQYGSPEEEEIGEVAFDDKGNIIWSLNYVNNKPNEVSIYIRFYDVSSKTFTEIVNKEYYLENGLLRKEENNEQGYTLLFEYTYY